MVDFFKILFFSISFDFTTSTTIDNIRTRILKKNTKSPGWISLVRYSVNEGDTKNTYYIVRRDYLIPLFITISINPELKTLRLKFRPLISPLFILAPPLLFLFPMLAGVTDKSSGANIQRLIILSGTLILFILTCLFSYIPVIKEKKNLIRELHLERSDIKTNSQL